MWNSLKIRALSTAEIIAEDVTNVDEVVMKRRN